LRLRTAYFFFFAAFFAFLAGFLAAFLAFFFVAISEPPLWRRAQLPAALHRQLQPDVEPQLLHL
jgi:hypothetical protein